MARIFKTGCVSKIVLKWGAMGLYLRQLLAGRDFAKEDMFAGRMANFVYLVGDDEVRECFAVDPAWDIRGILDYLDSEEMRLVGVVATHYHPDHVGGEIFGHQIEGLADLMALRPVPVHVNKEEKEGIRIVTGLSSGDLIAHEGGDHIRVGSVVMNLLHTPGHTPGSQCILSRDRLIAGDTLFIGGCGRVDLPGGDAEQMYYSLTQVLGKLADATLLYPGHNYAERAVSSLGEERKSNYCLRIKRLEDWLEFMGGD